MQVMLMLVYGFTANPNQYFTPSTPSLPSSDLAFTDKSINFSSLENYNRFRSKVGFTGTVEGFTARI
jgi:hypothetical protein